MLVILRVFQGIAVGGEWGGAALMALEHSESGRRGFAASFVNAGAPTGAVLGTFIMGAFSALPNDQFLAWGWRVPFLLSFVLLGVGMFVRLKVSESPIFKAALEQEKMDRRRATQRPERSSQRIPLLQVLRQPQTLIFTMLAGAAGFALQVVLATFAVTFAVSKGADRQGVLYAYAAASLISIAFVVLGGRLSDKLGRRPVMIGGLVLFIALPRADVPAAVLQQHRADLRGLHRRPHDPLHALWTARGLRLRTVRNHLPLHRGIPGLPVGHPSRRRLYARHRGADLQGLRAKTPASVVWYLAIMSVVSIVFILLTREPKNNDLQTVKL